jgi:hypothetical protein
VPPGDYEVNFWLDNGPAPSGEFVATFARTRARAGHVEAAGRQPVTLRFRLPEIDAPPIWVGATSRELTDRVRMAELVVRRIERKVDGGWESAKQLEQVPGWPNAYLAYLDTNAYPENGFFWTHPHSETRMMVFPAGAARLHLSARSGAGAGEAHIEIDGVPTTVTLGPWETRTFDVALRPDQETVRLTFAFNNGFRPSDVDPTSHDSRWLGMYITVALS